MEGSVVSGLSVASGLPLAILVGALVLFIAIICGRFGKDQQTERAKDCGSATVDDIPRTVSQSTGQRTKGKKNKRDNNRQVQSVFNHPWSLGSLKGHRNAVLDMDFSNNGKYLVSCSEDRTVMLWLTKQFGDRDRKSIRVNVEYDHATKIKWSPDSKAFIIAQANGNAIEVFKLGKKPDGSVGNVQSAMKFPAKHTKDLIGIGIASNGKFIMTCSNDTNIIIWDLKGEVLATIDNHQVTTNFAAISPCGRFVASSGFTPDVKIWEVCFVKGSGEFKEVVRAFELKGHTAGVYSFAFNSDSSRMATVSKDSTWRLWDTKIEYTKGQCAYLLLTINYPHTGPSHIALSPDGRTVAIATDSIIYAYSAISGAEKGKIEDAHAEPIQVIAFDAESKYLLSAGDKIIRVFHNVVGYQATIEDLLDKKRKATGQLMKDRIQQQIDEAKTALKTILEHE